MSIVKVSNPVILLPGIELREQVEAGVSRLIGTQSFRTVMSKLSPDAPVFKTLSVFANWWDEEQEKTREKILNNIISSALLDTLEATSCWSKLHVVENRVESYITAQFELASIDGDSGDEICSMITKNLIDNEVNEQLCTFAAAIDGGHENWRVWAVRTIGPDFAVEDMGDYRVLDWMRQRELKNQQVEESIESGERPEIDSEDQRFIALLKRVQFENTPLVNVKLSRVRDVIPKKEWNSGTRS